MKLLHFINMFIMLAMVKTAWSKLPDLPVFTSTLGCVGFNSTTTPMNATCKEGEVIAVTDVYAGVKPVSSDCTPLKNGSHDLSTCCFPNETDCTSPVNSRWRYQLQCNGYRSCVTDSEQHEITDFCIRMNETTNANDSSTESFNQLNSYMYMEYNCIEMARVADICTSSTSLYGSNTELYVWYMANSTFDEENNSNCACSMEIDNCDTQLQITTVYSGSANVCAQNITAYDSKDNVIFNWSCEEELSFRTNTVNKTYIQMKFQQTENGSGNKFWFAFKASEEANITIKCPPSAQLFCTEITNTSESSTAPGSFNNGSDIDKVQAQSGNLPVYESTSGCFEINSTKTTINATCQEGEVIAVTNVYAGAKPSSSNCPMQWNTAGEINTCCLHNETDCTFTIDSSWRYRLKCNGYSSCITEINQTKLPDYCAMTETTKTYDNFTGTFDQYSNYMYMEYSCIKDARIADMCTASKLNGRNTILYIWNMNKTVFSEQSTESSCECSVEVDECDAQIEIFTVYSSSITCDQNITVYDSADTMILRWSCENNSVELEPSIIVNDTRLQIKFTNSQNSSGINIWLAFKATKEANMLIQCPPSIQSMCATEVNATQTPYSTTSFKNAKSIDSGLAISMWLSILIFSLVIFTVLITVILVVLRRRRGLKHDTLTRLESLTHRRQYRSERAANEYVSLPFQRNSAGTIWDSAKLEETSVATSQIETKHGVDYSSKFRTKGVVLAKERIPSLPNEPNMQIVKPLKMFRERSSDNDLNQTALKQSAETPISSENTDWDTVFRRLSEMLHPKKWKFFFICLYGYGVDLLPEGISVDCKISQIEANVDKEKNGMPALFLELFLGWRELMGEKTDAVYIEKALQEMGYNDILSNFRKMMRELPKINTKIKVFPRLPESKLAITGMPPLYSRVKGSLGSIQCYALHNQLHSERVHSSNSFHMRHHEVNEYSLHMNDDESTRNKSNQCNQHASSERYVRERALNSRSCRIMSGAKRHLSTTDSDTDEQVHSKYRKTVSREASSKKKSSCRSNRRQIFYRQSRKLYSSGDFDKHSQLDLILRYLPLGGPVLEKEYHLVLDHTILLIMKTNIKSERDVLSILCADYEEAIEHKGKRYGHIKYLIETQSTSFVLESEEWKCLHIFADHARKRIVERLSSEGNFIDSKYLFIRYDGTPLVKQLQESDEERQGTVNHNSQGTGNGSSTENIEKAESQESVGSSEYCQSVMPEKKSFRGEISRSLFENINCTNAIDNNLLQSNSNSKDVDSAKTRRRSI